MSLQVTFTDPATFDTWDKHEKYLRAFQKLMPYRIREILLISSPYDSYLIEEDGLIYEQIRREYHGLNLVHAPEVTHVSSASEAFEALEGKRFDMIITTLHIKDLHAVRFAKEIRSRGYTMPIVLLAYDNNERKSLVSRHDASVFDRVFIWQGDYRLLVAIIKCIEDRLNVENDSTVADVQSIILVENNVRFYSLYLPIIYTEIYKQSQRLIEEGVNLTHKYLRMRTRPKILLCTNYEEAWEYFEKYSENILGVISDINFRRGGQRDPEAGVDFVRAVKERYHDIPALVQSSSAEFAEKARALNASFVLKNSPTLLHEVEQFINKNFGFGDFLFRVPNGTVVGRAVNLKELAEWIKKVPIESIIYHAERNHFSNWLKARTEFSLAHLFRPKQVGDYETPEHLRDFLYNAIREYLNQRTRGIITEFDSGNFDPKQSFCRIGDGSLGGKARGLGFVNHLINKYRIDDKFAGIRISVPTTVVLGTEVFDQFVAHNDLFKFALDCSDDQEILRRFQMAPEFPEAVVKKLADFLGVVEEPIAVRSSSLLEDSQYQPFAGVYETYMLPNNNPDPNVRLHELLQAIRSVYASMFYKRVKDYIGATEYRLEEEKMAVVIQKIVGSRRDNRFYPDFSGVAKSHNFYPVAPQKASDGIALTVLGLGKMVVDGGSCVRFCQKYPRHILQFFSTNETLKSAQQEFFALDMRDRGAEGQSEEPRAFSVEDPRIRKYSLEDAEKDGALIYTGSTYSYDNNVVYDGISRQGQRLVTFAPILKHGMFPLAEILDFILELGSWSMGAPVEIEFAVNMNVPEGAPKEFGLLQMRPLVLNYEVEELNVDRYSRQDLIVQSDKVLGNGVKRNIYDLVVVDMEGFDRAASHQVAEEVAAFNALLRREERPYVLIGVGRWGTLDPWLGIPVTWEQISGAVAIVEASFKDLEVTPSQGSHFFQNLTSFNVGYFTINAQAEGFINWDWLRSQAPAGELKYTKHLRLESPLTVQINGHKNRGVILMPGKEE